MLPSTRYRKPSVNSSKAGSVLDFHTLTSSGQSSSADYSGPSQSAWNYAQASHNGCQAYPAAKSDMVIVVKTGATEVFNKLPPQLLTFLQCAKDDLLILSNLEQDIANYHIYDCLTNVIQAVKFNNSDFDLYKEQKRVKLIGKDIIAMGNRGSQGWALDKYKNIHTARKAWELRPNKAWYFFIDADTYMFWSSLSHSSSGTTRIKGCTLVRKYPITRHLRTAGVGMRYLRAP